jgi:imidazole glycerol-phosphate synthase subunit HisF
MLKRRIIPCLDIQNGRTVKGVNFKELRDAGCPIELALRYEQEGADELVFLAINANKENPEQNISLVRQIASKLRIPFTIGGGINTVEDAASYLRAGADKVSLNTAAVKRPELIQEIAIRYGKQCVVVAIDAKLIDEEWFVCTQGGNHITNIKVMDWAKQVKDLGAGEILLTSMEGDGMKSGFSLGITKAISEAIDLPVIASGGAGSLQDFKTVFEETRVTGALAASVFHYQEIEISDLKQYLNENNIATRNNETRL